MMVGLEALVGVLAVACVAFGADKEEPKTQTRAIIADVLRDYPGRCFASTLCATFAPGQAWELSPYCGRSTCAVADDGRLAEVVEDCLVPLENPKCKIDTEKTNSTASFPACCPVFKCEAGAKLEYPEAATLPPPTTTPAAETTSKGKGN